MVFGFVLREAFDLEALVCVGLELEVAVAVLEQVVDGLVVDLDVVDLDALLAVERVDLLEEVF